MAYKRNFRKFTKKRRNIFRRKPFSKFHKKSAKKFHQTRIVKVIRKVDHLYFTGIGMTDKLHQSLTGLGYACEFDANQIPDFNLYQSLFDQYKINKVKVQLTPAVTVNPPNLATPANEAAGRIWHTPDFDDAAAPTSADYVAAYDKSRVQQVFNPRPIIRTIYPCIKEIVQLQGGGSGAYRVQRFPWVDCASSNTTSYGLKLWLDPYVDASCQQYFYLQTTFFLSFKNRR